METAETGRAGGGTRPFKPSKKAIHRLRRANLRALVKGRFGGSLPECAKALHRSKNFVWQLLKGYRSIGEDSARFIEQTLGLQPGALGEPADEAFRRKDQLVHQKGGGDTTPITMVPVIKMKLAGGGQTARRKAMADASQFVPVPNGNPHMFCVPVEHTGMEPRLAVGDMAVVDPTRTAPVHDLVYMVRLKGKGNGGGIGKAIMRVACEMDSGFTYTRPPEGKHQDKTVYAATQVDHVIGNVVGTWHPLRPM